jgi:hypothetical protein
MTPVALERLLRRLPSDRLLELADTIRKAALLLDRGRPDDGLAALAGAAELLADAPSRPSTPSAAITLLDRARFDLERGWHAAAYDCAARATNLIAKEARNGR